MKVRDISLMATGAIIAIAVLVFASTVLNPPKAQAQAAAAAQGAAAITVTASPAALQNSSASVQSEGGLITINDFASRKVTVVAYESICNNFGAGSTGSPIILLSTNASFSY